MSALKKLSDRFGHLDSAHRVNKFSLILIVVIFAAIPLTVFSAVTLRQLNPQAATGQPSGLLPVGTINTQQPTFSWSCYCYTTSYRVYLKTGNSNFYAGTWYKDVPGTTADWGGWKSASYPAFPGFQNGIVYYWEVGCTPGYGGCTTSSTFSFMIGGDTTPPTAPSNLRLYSISPTAITVAWNAATDNVGIRGYYVNVAEEGNSCGNRACSIISGGASRGPNPPPVITNAFYTFTPDAKKMYKVFVNAVDLAGNVSGSSAILRRIQGHTTLDSDGDGFKDAVENYLGTDPNLACGTSGTWARPGWPPDLDDSRAINLVDLAKFNTFLGQDPDNDLNRWYDFDANGVIDSYDQGVIKLKFGSRC
ncbi:MAG TPA: fibronectin type III domain-containing protein [Candidatus Saccharimonadales bacterium]|nr:fibronectin type III domain-containing protein [Candidatus Saccharimonadales bacterium]